jgi:CubicO group peptidase (beta-lactamase class C family)
MSEVMKTKFNYLLLVILLSYLLSSCNEENIFDSKSSYVYTIPEETEDGWQTASLNSVGMNTGKIEFLISKIKNNEYKEVHSIIIVKDDKLVLETYYPGHDFKYNGSNFHGDYLNFDKNTRHDTHSATKSITSAVMGIAIASGYITSVDDKIFTYLSNYSSLSNPQKEKITIKHLLTMSSGLQWNEWDVSISQSNHDIVRFNQSYDPVQYLLSKPVIAEPGTQYYYNGGGVDLLGEIIKNATDLNLKTFSNSYLFGPLGITNYNWQTLYPSGMTCCHGDIYITPRDMAKFGYLYLKKGVWNGTRIISEEWINKSLQNHITPIVNWAYGYGYLWWLKKYDAANGTYYSYNAEGWGGQQIIIMPSENMVVVFTGANYVSDPPNDQIMNDYILPAID